MYAVIFRATIAEFSERYGPMAESLRRLAQEEFGCREFVSCTEGENEIAISYWDSLEQIRAWKQHPTHREAQQLGRGRWYRSYKVQVVRIEREYAHAG